MNFKKLIMTVFLAVSVCSAEFVHQPSPKVVAQAESNEPVTLDILDMAHNGFYQLWHDIDENLYLGLTDIDPFTHGIEPELATTWAVSEDGLTWTFHLRDDVYWMRYDPTSETAETLRLVVAGDFMKRLIGGTCYITVSGCSPFVDGRQANDTQSQLTEKIVVLTPDDFTLVFQLEYPSQGFLAFTTLEIFHPYPVEQLQGPLYDSYRPGEVITNGPYFLHQRSSYRSDDWIFVRNKSLPSDLQNEGNLDVVHVRTEENSNNSVPRYKQHIFDVVPLLTPEVQGIVGDSQLGVELVKIPNQHVTYFVFNQERPPFDNPLVRQAFSAIIDREALREDLRDDLLVIPTSIFTPPDIPFAPTNRDIGVGFDPDYARAQLAAAGYPDCQGLPPVVLDARDFPQLFTFWVESAGQYLNCEVTLTWWEQQSYIPEDPNQPSAEEITEEYNATFNGWLGTLMFELYPDTKAYLFDTLYCLSDAYYWNDLRWDCTNVDAVLQAAEVEAEPTQRTADYHMVETALFGPEGTFPMVPLFYGVDAFLVRSWVSGPIETDGFGGGRHWDTYTVDMEAKVAGVGTPEPRPISYSNGLRRIHASSPG